MEREWDGRAAEKIGDVYVGKDSVSAEKAYRRAIAYYSQDKGKSSSSRGKLADLYWNSMDKRREAMALWAELAAEKRLPYGTPYGKSGIAIPEVVYNRRYAGDDFSSLRDFLPLGRDRMFLVSVIPPTVPFARHVVPMELYDIPSGQSSLLSMFPEKFMEVKLYNSGDGYLASCRGYSCRLDSSGRLSHEILPGGINMVFPDYSDGNLLAVDTEKNTLWKLNASGKKITKLGPVKCNYMSYAFMASNMTGMIVYGSDSCVRSLTPDGADRAVPSPYNDRKYFDQVSAVCLDGHDNIYILAPDKHKIIKFGPNGAFLAEYQVNQQRSFPLRAAMDTDGSLYTVDMHGRITVLDSNLRPLRDFGEKAGIIPANPTGIAVRNGVVYLAYYSGIVVIDAGGRITARISVPDSFVSLGMDRAGTVFFSSAGKIYRLAGDKAELVTDLGFPMGKKGGSLMPAHVVFGFGPDNSMYVTDSESHSFRHIDSSGKVLISARLTEKLRYAVMMGTVVDSAGNLKFLYRHEEAQSPVLFEVDPETGDSVKVDLNPRSRKEWSAIQVFTDKVGNFYINDKANSCLLKYDRTMEFIGKLDFSLYDNAALVDRVKLGDDGAIYALLERDHVFRILRFAPEDVQWAGE